MNFQFDHVVHYVHEPTEAMKPLQKQGLHAVEGGRHENLGTHNALSYFDLSYIELIGIFDQQLIEMPAEEKYSLKETIRRNKHTNGLRRIALRSTNLEADAERFRKLGLEVYGPSPLSRRRPDGSLLSWKLLFAGMPDDALELPFFIEWQESDEERRQELTRRSTIADHPRGPLSLSSVGFAVKDSGKTCAAWSNYLGLEAGEWFFDKKLNARGQKLKLAGGDLAFYIPIGEGVVSHILNEQGETPFMIAFSGSEVEEEVEMLGAVYRFTK
ncbi:MAG: VOC family protein [Bacillus sp. (in: firmicutes)]